MPKKVSNNWLQRAIGMTVVLSLLLVIASCEAFFAHVISGDTVAEAILGPEAHPGKINDWKQENGYPSGSLGTQYVLWVQRTYQELSFVIWTIAISCVSYVAIIASLYGNNSIRINAVMYWIFCGLLGYIAPGIALLLGSFLIAAIMSPFSGVISSIVLAILALLVSALGGLVIYDKMLGLARALFLDYGRDTKSISHKSIVSAGSIGFGILVISFVIPYIRLL